MIPLHVEGLADVVGGELVGSRSRSRDGDGAGATVTGVVIDSRQARQGALFAALVGERDDGVDFVGDAKDNGATAALVAADHRARVIDAGLPCVLVDDVVDALAGLGRWVRDEIDPLVVAVTGSNGKTTTKDLIAAAVGARRSVVAAQGSFNNELGTPLTCCRLEPGSEVLVAELGARGIGHVATLAAPLRPDVGVVTTISGAHLELFGSIDAIEQAKGELVEALTPDGLAVLNADDPRVARLAARTDAEVVTYGLTEADWQAHAVVLDDLARATFRVRGRTVRLPLPGRHQVGNALAALVVAERAGVGLDEAAAALGEARISPWRGEVTSTRSGLVVVNDAYNANPASTIAALETLAGMRCDGRRVAVLGEMAELGTSAGDAHAAVGEALAHLGIDGLVTVGDAARGVHAAAAVPLGGPAADGEEALALLAEVVTGDDVVLVKASRSAGLERVAHGLIAAHDGPATEARA